MTAVGGRSYRLSEVRVIVKAGGIRSCVTRIDTSIQSIFSHYRLLRFSK